MIRAYLAILSVAFGASLIGCTPQGREDMAQGAEKMGEGIRKDADATGKVLKEKGAELNEKMKPVINNAKEKMDAGTMSARVKDVLNQTKTVDSSHINVDTDNAVVHLKGSVPTEEQKAEAERLAQGVAGNDYKVSNELAVAAH